VPKRRPTLASLLIGSTLVDSVADVASRCSKGEQAHQDQHAYQYYCEEPVTHTGAMCGVGLGSGSNGKFPTAAPFDVAIANRGLLIYGLPGWLIPMSPEYSLYVIPICIAVVIAGIAWLFWLRWRVDK
jgi:hypothetical protein